MNKKTLPLIFECANAHGGDYALLQQTIQEFGSVSYDEKYIKFQPFHPDTIATKDYEWYNVYKELFLPTEKWKDIIDLSRKYFKGVFLDIFDTYGIEIFIQNTKLIKGIKLQASVLDNQEVIASLKSTDLSNKFLVLNISGYEISQIEQVISQFSTISPRAEIILQIGYQAYPTKLEDSGLQKISIIRSAFPNYQICLADHVDAESEWATILPLLGVSLGCSIIEKHIVLKRESAKYDKFSALHKHEMQSLADRLTASQSALKGPFISAAEANYLAKTVQVPILKHSLASGSLISKTDIIFRRTSSNGLTFKQIENIQSEKKVIDFDLKPGDVVQTSNFKTARIGTIVACRMKSSRLKSKAILPINGIASVERCLNNAIKIRGVHETILATSDLKEDAILANYTLNGKVRFWQGHPDDVIHRYLGACEFYNLDVIVRITADCPVVSSEIAEYLLNHHFQTGADYTAAKNFSVGTSCEIYNVQALKEVINYLGSAQYSEYMTWYMQNNIDIFKVELVDLPTEYIRDYRLTLDYPEDMELFSGLFERLESEGKEASLSNVFNILDQDPKLATLNSHLVLKYKTDQELIDRLNEVTKIKIK
ncbi:cytidylyltransferase domain-containing protein [Methylobacillus pratensis]